MKCAIISDIHANLAALEAVLADIDSIGDISEIWCLGDIVGYGPQPVECYHLAMERCSIVIKGNHEKALEPNGGERFNERARRAISWTHDTISALPDGGQILTDISNLPTNFTRENMLFVHGSPSDPTNEYLMPRDSIKREKMRRQFPMFETYCFVGHTHFPGVIEEGEVFVKPEDMMMGIYFLDNACKAIINVGSVGQPRDHNSDSCYVVFDGDSVKYRRVKYDIEKTRKLIYATDGIDNILGDRLVAGR